MSLLEKLRGGLVVSCQPVDNGPMDQPQIVAAMAQAAVAGGALGLRIEGLENLRAVRPLVAVPIIGLIKRDLTDSPIRITPFSTDVRDLAAAGADIIAYDATDRVRPEAAAALLSAIRATGALAMADCATLAEARAAYAQGAAILGSTLSGYTADTQSSDPEPNFALVRDLAATSAFVMAEGRYHSPDLVARARKAGADAVTVGTALTRLEHMVGWFVAAMQAER